MIYTDGIHLVADTLDELHTYALSIDIRCHWFEGVRKGHPHYDIPKSKKDQVLSDPKVKHVRSREILRISKTML